jgi:enoyl-CoA hydratase
MIHLEERGSITVLRLDHGKVNALDSELLVTLRERLAEVEASPARALVLTGAGSCFSAGVDLWRVLEGGPAYVEEFVPLLSGALSRLFSFPRPVVAAINGHAIAGGCVIACACDYRIMATGPGLIGVPELRVGVPFPVIAFEILQSAAPSRLLNRLVYLGEMFGPERAEELGLIDQALPPESVMECAGEVAEGLSIIPADTFRVTKRQLREPILERAAHAGAAADAEAARIWASDEVMAAIRDHMERSTGRRSRSTK